MAGPISRRHFESAGAAVVAAYEPAAAALVARRDVSPELAPWVAIRLARADAEALLQILADLEVAALQPLGLQPDFLDGEAVDVTQGETVCRRCVTVVQLRWLSRGGAVVLNRDGSRHLHPALGAPLDDATRAAVAQLCAPTEAPDTARKPPWERWA